MKKEGTVSKAIFGVVLLLLISLMFAGFSFAERKIPIYRVEREEQQIAISFDCCWGAEKTAEILAVLEENNVPATFFMVSMWAEKYPENAKSVADSGCEVGCHSHTHPHFAKLSREETQKEIENSNNVIKTVTGVYPAVFRPPFGEYTNDMIEICESLGQKVIQWDVDTLDWKGLSATEINQRIQQKTKNGSIILMHNNADNVVDAIKLAIPLLKEKGYEFVKMSELVYEDGYKIDSNGEQKLIPQG